MLLLLLWLAGPARADVVLPLPAVDPQATLDARGCTACHSLDGAAGRGPTLAGLWGRSRVVLRGGQRLEAPFDDAALRLALADPDAERPEGQLGNMPRYTLDEAELSEIGAALRALGDAPVDPPPPPSGLSLALATAAFVFGHLGLSSRPVRRRLIEALEPRGFQGVYALLILAAFMWMLVAWAQGPQQALWAAPRWTTHLPIAVMPLVMILWVAGYSTPGPTTAGMDGKLDQPGELARGILRVTRHPANLGNTLWAVVHLAANPELRNVLLFGGMLILSVLGSLHIDARRAAEHPEGWGRFAAETSLLPFVAIAQGRNRFVFSEIGWGRVLGGLAAFGAFLLLHPWLIGVSPLPGGAP